MISVVPEHFINTVGYFIARDAISTSNSVEYIRYATIYAKIFQDNYSFITTKIRHYSTCPPMARSARTAMQ